MMGGFASSCTVSWVRPGSDRACKNRSSQRLEEKSGLGLSELSSTSLSFEMGMPQVEEHKDFWKQQFEYNELYYTVDRKQIFVYIGVLPL